MLMRSFSLFSAEQMDTEQNLFEHEAHFDSEEDVNLKQKWKTMEASAVLDDDSGHFGCNICFDSAHDPVVTFCGHLYCWPCMYKWLHVKSSSPNVDHQQPSCPVCKANISPNTLVPLYGRGTSSESESKKASPDVIIPRRPPPSGLNNFTSYTPHQSQLVHQNLFPSSSHSFHHGQYFHDSYGAYTIASSSVGGTTMTSIFNPMIGLFGEMVFARIFGTSDASLFTHPFPNTNHLLGSNNRRMRRQEMQLDKSLNRVTIFLLCCIILCLLLF